MRAVRLAAALASLAVTVVTHLPAANAGGQPYGGCKEGWQAPHSAGARWCRAHGWTVRSRLVVNPRAVVVFSRLPACEFEDGSGGPRPCAWNGEAMGNRYGLSYWIDRSYRAHYGWGNGSPATTPWKWVSHEFADVLAEGGYPGADRRRWERCVTRDIPNGWRVRCPNGYTLSRTETSETFS